ncbi:MAG: hypothetical protein WCF22_15960, partial [Candidatus Sulfotelmatobacter sp.]
GPPRRSWVNSSLMSGRVVPYPELVHGTPQHFIAAVSVTALKGRIHFQKTPLLEGCNGERDGARVEYVLKFLFRQPAVGL